MTGAVPRTYKGWRNPTPTSEVAPLDVVVNGTIVESFGGDPSVITSAGAASAGILSGRGTSASPVTISTAGKFISQYFASSVTSGSVEGLYTRTYITGAVHDPGSRSGWLELA